MNHKSLRVVRVLIVLLSLSLMASSAVYSETLQLPSQGSAFFIPFAPIAAPDTTGTDVTYIKPLGLGNLTLGTISPTVTIDFSGAADLYVGLTTTVAPDQWYLLWEDGSFHDISDGLRPWRERVMGINNNWLFDEDIPLSVLQPYPGTYNLYLMAVPNGTDLQTPYPYYLWETSFVVAPLSLSLSPTNIDFGSTSGPKSQDIILTNTSNNSNTISISLNDPSGVFSITANSCTATLVPQQSCTVTVSVNPGAVVPGGIELQGVDISIVQEAALNAAAKQSPVRLTIPVIARPVQAAACIYSTGSAVPSQFAAAGGTGSIQVTASPAGCVGSWTAASNADWITITAGGSGSASGAVSFTVAASTLSTQRTGTITVNGAAQTITQAATAPTNCSSPTLTPVAKSFGASSATGTIQLTTGAGCAWTATGFFLSPWLRVTSPTSGNGSAAITYAVDAYTGSGTRTGSLYIAGKTFTATQSGSGCSYTLSPSSATLGSAAGNGQFQVALSSTCIQTSPTLTVSDGWLHLSSSTKTSTGYTVVFTVDPNNTGTTRYGTITVAGTRDFTVTQNSTGTNPPPPGCTYSLNPNNASYTTTGGLNNTFQVTATGTSCSWTASSSDTSWLTVNSPTGAQTTGGTVTYTVAPNDTAGSTARSAYITIGDQRFQVYEEGAIVNPTTIKYDTYQFGTPPPWWYANAPAPGGSAPSLGRDVYFVKVTLPVDGCPTNNLQFWIGGMTSNGNMIIAGPDNEFGSMTNAWNVYNAKLTNGYGYWGNGPDYWYKFASAQLAENVTVQNPNGLYKGKTFYIMFVNEGPDRNSLHIQPQCY